MASMLNQDRFGAHGDVLSAAPEDAEGKATLCEEIKSRARSEFGRKNLPMAEMLYSKGLHINPDDATLHSNLAAVRLGLNKPETALENAEEAVLLDPAYAKAHYRKGQALSALSRPAEAAQAFRAGAALEPESKLWPPLILKAAQAAETAAAAKKTSAKTMMTTSNGSAVSSRTTTVTNGGKTPSSQAPPVTSRNPPSSSSSSPSPLAATENGDASGEGIVESGGGGSGGSETGRGMKGYKKTADGRLTTYFNNELTEEAKALIGDIAPKRLEAFAAAATTGEGGEGGGGGGGEGNAGSGAAGNDVSAWNKAGTWESRDMTSWAKQRLNELLLGAEFDASESAVEVVKVEKLEGDAEISFSRGKKRNVFDFRFELKWEASDLECGPAKGVLVFPDFGQDCDGVYDVECRVDSSTPTAAKAYVDRHVRAEGSGLRQVVLARLATFISEFNAK